MLRITETPKCPTFVCILVNNTWTWTCFFIYNLEASADLHQPFLLRIFARISSSQLHSLWIYMIFFCEGKSPPLPILRKVTVPGNYFQGLGALMLHDVKGWSAPDHNLPENILNCNHFGWTINSSRPMINFIRELFSCPTYK